MNIKEMTTEQLKAMAYDTLVAIEVGQNNLKVINQEISLRNSPIEPQNAQGEEIEKELEDDKAE